MEAIVICTVNNPGLTILLESIKVYAPNIPIYLSTNNIEQCSNDAITFPNTGKTFGEAYNIAIDKAFKGGWQSVIVCNDDVVLTPSSFKLMKEDWDRLVRSEVKLGFVGARSDYVLPEQNIRFPMENDSIIALKYASESYVKQVGVIAPIFASLSKQAWQDARFPHTNWYSDNIMCDDLSKKGYHHFVSRSYVHHAGSQTVGVDFAKCHEEPREWIKANRPDVYEDYYG